MIYLDLLSVNLLATANNKTNQVAKGLAYVFFKRYESGEIFRLEFVSKISTDTKGMIYPRSSL